MVIPIMQSYNYDASSDFIKNALIFKGVFTGALRDYLQEHLCSINRNQQVPYINISQVLTLLDRIKNDFVDWQPDECRKRTIATLLEIIA